MVSRFLRVGVAENGRSGSAGRVPLKAVLARTVDKSNDCACPAVSVVSVAVMPPSAARDRDEMAPGCRRERDRPSRLAAHGSTRTKIMAGNFGI